MTNNSMIYKGYTAVIAFSAEDECLVGHILGINDIVGFHGEAVEEIRKAFEEAVDFYLESCEKNGNSAQQALFRAYYTSHSARFARPNCHTSQSQRNKPE